MFFYVYRTWKGYSLKKGPNYAPKRKKVATDLTRENLQRYDMHLILLSWEEWGNDLMRILASLNLIVCVLFLFFDNIISYFSWTIITLFFITN